MPGVYVHIPFCKRRCSYCDFYSVASLQRKDQMIESLLREIDLRLRNGEKFEKSDEPYTVYFGGGSPSVTKAEEINALYRQAVKLLPDDRPVDEFTVEANPEDLAPDYCRQLIDAGVDRLSIGIQSFVDRDLTMMKRRHDAAQNRTAVENAQSAGFENIGIDLIYGIPGAAVDDTMFDIRSALDLQVQHISAYYLTIEPNTLLGRKAASGNFTPIDDEIGAHRYEILVDMLGNAGYEQYEVSNFALPGFRSKHNSSYWLRRPYIGIGPSAHGYDGKYARTSNVSNNVRYIESIEAGRIPAEAEFLTDADIYNESLLTSLRTAYGFDPSTVKKNFREYFLARIKKHIVSGTVIVSEGRYVVPSRYLLISDSVVTDLFYQKPV